jgi:tetratricopeptide (TPR) repeat protein
LQPELADNGTVAPWRTHFEMIALSKLSSILAPAVVLCLFAVFLPVSIPLPASGLSKEACLTLADTPVAARNNDFSLLERCSAICPNDVELLKDLGAAYESASAASRAEATYRRALSVDPSYAELRLRLGLLLLRRGADAEARHEATEALRVQPNRQALLDLLRAADKSLGGASQ